jgi:16S rRNA (guanine966-N2)-methyltransferase
MSHRVIGGEFRGRRLVAPTGHRTRPTRAAVREAWFSAIADWLPDASVFDLFAGTGALGIEALSRGAAAVTFVESDASAYRALRENVTRLEISERVRTERREVFGWLEGLEGVRADVALADPPYGEGTGARLLDVWLTRPFADILCIEHERGELGGSRADWNRGYGDSELSFYVAATGKGD